MMNVYTLQLILYKCIKSLFFIFRLHVAVYYDDAFYQKFGTRFFTRIAATMALVAEQYSEHSFKARLEMTMKSVKHAT